MGLLSVSVDLDEISCYHQIHGIDEPPSVAASTAVYDRALPRIADFFDEHSIRGTFFCVGANLRDNPRGADLIADLSKRGHEISNHTMNHRYDLTLQPADIWSAEIDDCAGEIQRVTGVRPPGFRAPGYNVHLGLLDQVASRGYSYDSSVFPCPAYYAAKVAAIGLKGVAGRASVSIIGDPRILGAPVMPYKVGRDGAWTKGDGLLELPITVFTGARLPLIGTSLVMAGRVGASLMGRAVRKMRFVNLELHGVDFLDGPGDGVGYLAEHQRDLKISLNKKLDSISAAVKVMLDFGMQAMPLAEAAGRVIL